MASRRLLHRLTTATLICQISLGIANAEVTSKSDTAFSVHHEYTVARSSEPVYAKFVDIGSWWHPDHTWTGDASNMSLDPRPGGLFVERFPSGGFSEHMRVIAARPHQLVRMSGGLGPLQEFAVVGVMSVQFRPTEKDTTRVVVDYRVSGSFPGGMAAIAEAVDRVIGEQFSRLKSACESPDSQPDPQSR